MASTFSTNLKIELQATGENSGTWGTITNTNLGTALEQAIVGYGNPSYASDANLTLTYTDTNAAQTARALVLNVTSAVSLSATRELVVPTIQKQYIVQNNTTGSQSITVKTSAGTGITVPNGRKAHLYVDGTNVIYMDDYVDINGGAIDGTPIGANSASTGAFTTLSASGNITVSGGTANGVLYLNGSKVATSGSALTFDGTTLANINSDGTGFSTQSAASNFSIMRFGTDSVNGYAFFQSGKSGTGTTLPFAWRQDSSELMRLTSTGLGIGTSSPARRLSVLGANAIETLASFTSQGTDANAQIDLTPTGVAWGIVNASTTALAFSVAGSTKALINTSGNMGIGTSSPATKLQIGDGSSGSVKLRIHRGAGTDYSEFWNDTGTTVIDTVGGGNLDLRMGNSSKATLTAGGNLGLGVTPSAWATYPAFQVSAVSLSGLGWMSNVYYNGGYKYINSEAAARMYSPSSGGIIWNLAASGTAGNAITFTQAMTLDASGNLLVGTTQAPSRLTVSGTASEISGIIWNNSGSNGDTAALYLSSVATTQNLSRTAAIKAIIGSSNNHALAFFTNPDFAAPVERLRITSAGDVGIGTSSPAVKLDVQTASAVGGITLTATTGTNGAAINCVNTGGSSYFGRNNSSGGAFGGAAYATVVYGGGAYPMSFYTNDTERMRLDSSGNLGINTTSPAAKLEVNGAIRSNTNITGPLGYFFTSATNPASTGASGNGLNLGYDANGEVCWIQSNRNSVSETRQLLLNPNGGNVGIGTTGTGARLDVRDTASTTGSIFNLSNISSAAAGNIVPIRFFTGNTFGGLEQCAAIWGINPNAGTNNGGALVFATSANGTATTPSERARITSGGYLLVGDTTHTDGSIFTATGVTSLNAYRLSTTAAQGIFGCYSDTGGTKTVRAYIQVDGGLANYSANNVNLSDQRVKDNINPAGSYWNKIKALEIVTFRYKDQDENDQNIGVIAQQVETVAPEFVSNDGFGETPEGEEPLKTVYTTDMYHAAIKALQEAMARIEKLEAEVAALKGA